MPSLYDLASDLINKAKLASDSKQKLYSMEQVKEIVFHRDKTLLSSLIPEIFELMLERSIAVRRFLVKIAGDALKEDISLTPNVLSLFSFLVVDGNDKILQSIAQELSNYYDKISIFVAKMPTRANTASYQQQEAGLDPRDLWHQLRSMASVLMETIASNRTEALRIQCIKLCESMMLFGLPPSVTSVAKDPRMARVAGARTLLEIPLHHAFIDRNDIEKEADSTLSKMVLWARRGGPQGFRFPPQVMSQLGQSIGAVAAERLDRFKVVGPALVFLVNGAGNVCCQMNVPARQQLSFTLVRVIRAVKAATSVSSNVNVDPDGLSGKLQEALSELDKLNGAASTTGTTLPTTAANTAAALAKISDADPRKRRLMETAAMADVYAQEVISSVDGVQQDTTRNETGGVGTLEEDEEEEDEDMEGDDDEEEDELDEDGIRASALAAVDAAESQMVSAANKKMRLDDLLAGTNPLSIVSGGAGIAGTGGGSGGLPSGLFSPTSAAESGCSVPAIDLGAFPSDATTSMRLVTLKHGANSGTTARNDPRKPAASKKAECLFESITPPADVYSELAMGSLSKLLGAAIEPSHPPKLKLLLRTVLAMASIEAQCTQIPSSGASAMLNIAILKSRSVSSQLLRDSDGSVPRLGRVPMDITLPRSIWLYISHCLQSQESIIVSHKAAVKESNTDFLSSLQCDRLDLILALAREIYASVSASREGRLLTVQCAYVPMMPSPDEESEEEGAMGARGMDEEGDAPSGGGAYYDDEDDEGRSVPLYDGICLVVLTRMLQRKKLRPHAVRMLKSLPAIPLVCIHLLELLLLTGTRTGGPATTQYGIKKRGANAERGMRMVVLDIMGSLLLHEGSMNDPHLFRACLFPMLWLTITEDFSLRTAAVNSLVGVANKIDREYEPGDGLSFVRTAIVLFALQGSLSVVGIDSYTLRLAQRGIAWHRTSENFGSDTAILGLISDIDFENVLDLRTAATVYNSGALFGGKFTDIRAVRNESDVQPYAKRSLHLLLQLSLSRPTLLVPLLDLYGTARGIQLHQNASGDEAASGSLSEELKSAVQTLPQGCGEILCQRLQKEVLNITPAVTTSSRDTDAVFETLLQADVQALPMLILVLNSVLVDLEIPASDRMVRVVRSLFDSLPEENKDIRLLIPVLGGMTREDVEALLPRLILELQQHDGDGDASSAHDSSAVGGAGADGEGETATEYMRKCIARITRARPPPLSRANLLVALHRIDNDAHNIKLKTLLETIGLCLSAKDEFKSDVIKEAVTTLLEDPVPPKALMRTVILSAQSLPDIKKFVLTVVVPKLILMRTWDLAPKVWDGVVMCVKVMAGNKDSEPTIRALIGLPLPQLRGILKIAPDTGVYLARLLRSLSAEEVEEVLSGKWAHLQSENSESQKKDKAKLIQEMSTGGSGSNKGVGR